MVMKDQERLSVEFKKDSYLCLCEVLQEGSQNRCITNVLFRCELGNTTLLLRWDLQSRLAVLFLV